MRSMSVSAYYLVGFSFPSNQKYVLLSSPPPSTHDKKNIFRCFYNMDKVGLSALGFRTNHSRVGYLFFSKTVQSILTTTILFL